MTVTPKKLFTPATLTNSAATYYTVPASTKTVLKKCPSRIRTLSPYRHPVPCRERRVCWSVEHHHQRKSNRTRRHLRGLRGGGPHNEQWRFYSGVGFAGLRCFNAHFGGRDCLMSRSKWTNSTISTMRPICSSRTGSKPRSTGQHPRQRLERRLPRDVGERCPAYRQRTRRREDRRLPCFHRPAAHPSQRNHHGVHAGVLPRAGVSLLRYGHQTPPLCRKIARRARSKKFYLTTKKTPDLSRLFEMLGYRPDEVTFSKIIGE